jgi:hypothetical protein
MQIWWVYGDNGPVGAYPVVGATEPGTQQASAVLVLGPNGVPQTISNVTPGSSTGAFMPADKVPQGLVDRFFASTRPAAWPTD